MHFRPRAFHIIFGLALASLALLLSACEDPIQFSPLAVETSERHLTQRNISAIESQSLSVFAPFKFALLADTHAYYSEFDRAVRAINQRDDIAFVLHAGDVTDWGLLQEYDWSTTILARLTVPYLTVIGNHDAINNGKENYQAIFGPYDYSLIYNQVKIVVLNDVSWEFDNQVPRLDWLAAELGDYQLYRHQMVLTHVPPDDQERFSPLIAPLFIDTLKSNFTALVMSGHYHAHSYREELLNNGLPIGFLVTGTLNDNHYIVVSVEADHIEFERVFF